jgi:hypothetical protein
MTAKTEIIVAAACAALIIPQTAAAYIGPGAGLSVGGAIIGVLGALMLAVAVLLTWPIRLVIRKLRSNRPPATAERPDDAPGTRGASPG